MGELSKYMQSRDPEGRDVVASCLLPHARQIIATIFGALEAEPCSLMPPVLSEGAAGRQRPRLRRLGIDMLVDEAFHVWFMEVNVLRDGYGLGCARGPGGDLKRRLVERLKRAEALLTQALLENAPLPTSFEDILL